MQRFLDFLIAFKEYVALTVFITVSMVLIAMSRNTDAAGLRAYTTAIVGAIQSTYAWIPNPVTLARENRELQERTITLSSEVGRLRRASVENDELRKMLGIVPRKEWKIMPCEVVGKTTTFERNMMTLNRGAKEGVVKGMAVITDAGLVGRIYAVSDNFSLVEMLFNRDFRAAAKIARSRIEGIIAWDGGPTLVMRNVPKALDAKVGDLVVTSEYSTFFPSDVPIGVILRLEPEPNTLFRRITIDPAVNLYRVEHCFIVMKDEAMEKERLALETQAKQEEVKQGQRQPGAQSGTQPSRGSGQGTGNQAPKR